MLHIGAVSRVDFNVPNNVWWEDALQFGDPNDTTWAFTGKHFLLDIKAKRTDVSAVLALTSAANQIVVDDAPNRILHLNVTDTVIRAAPLRPTDLDAHPPVEPYHYDLVMVDDGTGERTLLCYGEIWVFQGVTIED